MVLVAMGQKNSLDFLLVFEEVRNIGDDIVDAKHLFFRKLKTGIDHQDVVAVLISIHILAYLTHAPEWNKLQIITH